MKKIIVFVIVSFISLNVLSPAALAASAMRGGDKVIVDQNEIINDNLFAGGESIIISGTVNGDAYVVGSHVTIDGTINGDLLIAGQDLDLRGTVTGDIRGAGQSITISGRVGGNLTLGSSQIFITDSASIDGSLVAGAGELNIAAPITKGITAGVGSMYLSDRVGGDLTYWSDQEIVLSPEASVSGTVTRHEVEKSRHPEKAAAGAAAGFQFMQFLGMFLLGTLLIKFAPVYAQSVVSHISTKPWVSLLIGFISVIMIPVTILIIAVTVIGLPLAFVGLLAYLLLLIFAKVFAALFVGTKVLNYFNPSPNVYLVLGAGLLLTSILAMIPVIGWIFSIGFYFMAVGGIILHRKTFYDSLRTKKLI